MSDLIATDPIVAQNFYLELDDVKILLNSVSGLDVEYDVVSINQAGPGGKRDTIKTRGNQLKVTDITVERMAPMKALDDPIWKWFYEIHDTGMKIGSRTDKRKNGSIVLYDSSLEEVGRFNFFRAWPSKISTGQLSSEANDAVKETITIVTERIQRVK